MGLPLQNVDFIEEESRCREEALERKVDLDRPRFGRRERRNPSFAVLRVSRIQRVMLQISIVTA